MAAKYPYTVTPEKDGTFFVKFLDFPTGITEGSSAENAKAMAEEMVAGLVECYKADGMALPTASAVGELDFVEIEPG